jgi:hypothetical protein
MTGASARVRVMQIAGHVDDLAGHLVLRDRHSGGRQRHGAGDADHPPLESSHHCRSFQVRAAARATATVRLTGLSRAVNVERRHVGRIEWRCEHDERNRRLGAAPIRKPVGLAATHHGDVAGAHALLGLARAQNTTAPETVTTMSWRSCR